MKNLIVKFDKNESLIIKLFRIASICISLICIFMAMFSEINYNLWVLPLTYSMGMFLLGNTNVTGFTPGIITLNIVMFLRYSIVPFAMYIEGNPIYAFSTQSGHMNEAIFIMWFELIIILITIHLSGKQYKLNVSKILLMEGQNITFENIKYGSVICFFGILLCGVMVWRYPYLIGGIELLTQGYLSTNVDVSSISGAVGIVWKAWITWLSIYFIYILKKKNLKGKGLTFFLVGAIFLIVLLSFIGQTTISRWYTIVTFCAIYFCAIKMFPNKKKHITRLTIIPALIILFIVTIYKNTGYLLAEGNMIDFVKELFDASTLNSYFAGPFNVNNAIYMKEYGNTGFFSIFYDLLRNFPILNHYVDISKSTVGAYALYLGRSDQIIPLVGQSMIYFGYLFAPLISAISVILVRFFDKQYLKSKSLNMYIYAFTACWIALATILNFTICVSWFYVTIIPAYLLIRLTEIKST